MTELRFATRALLASPGFTLIIVLTLALGVGVTTAMFSLVDRIVLAPLPFANPDELVLVEQIVPPIRDRYPVVGANLRSIAAWRAGCHDSCSEIAAFEGLSATLSVGGEPQGVVGARVDAHTLDVFGIRPVIGRGIDARDTVAGSDRVLLLSHDLWRQRFGADPAVIGRTVSLDSIERQIIGVLPEFPRLPRLEQLTAMRRWVGHAQVLVPFIPLPNQVQSAGDFSYIAIVRLRPGVTKVQASDELTRIAHAAFEDAPFRPEVLVSPLGERVVGSARQPLWLSMGAVLALLVVACVNVAHLVAGRWLGRRAELALRVALGARASDLLRHVSAEATCLAILGATFAVAVAYAAVALVVSWAPVEIPRIENVAVDIRALAFGIAVTTICTFLSCLLPVWRVINTPTKPVLQEGAQHASESRAGVRLRRMLVGLEVATTVALLILAGLLLVSFVRVNNVERGFVTRDRVALDLTLSPARYPSRVFRTAAIDQLLESIQSMPGVDVVAAAQKLPLEGEASVDLFVPQGTEEFDGRPQPVGSHKFVSPDYFRALQLPLLAGRVFDLNDRQRRVAIVSASTARTLWPGQNPIGQRFSRSRKQEAWEVIGVVADTHTETLERQPGLAAYVPHWDERSGPDLSLVISTFADPATVLAGVRHAIARVDPDLAILKPRTLEQVVNGATATRRFQMSLTMAFAITGLVVACLGIYAVLSADLLRRRGELALRVAIGASTAHITRMVMVEGLTPVAFGLVAGCIFAAPLGSLVSALLFGVSPYDPLVFASVAGLIVFAAMVACAAPLVRALKTSPILTLRNG